MIVDPKRVHVWSHEKQDFVWVDYVPPGCVARKWRYVTMEDLISSARRMIPKLPQQVNRIIGMHRSGTPAAAFIASILHVPCDTFSEATGVQYASGGYRFASINQWYEDGVTVVVDDTVWTGSSLGKFKKWAAANDPTGRYVYAAVFALPEATKHVDLYCELLPDPHLLEWNLFQCGWVADIFWDGRFVTGGIAFDFDGVLCIDPPREFNEDDPTDRAAYLDWIASAQPLNPVRMHEIPLVVSYRCEYTRAATLAWLERHKIRVKRLELWPGEPSTRTWKAKDWKGRLYRDAACSLFAESCTHQAHDIAAVSGKRVLDMEKRQILGE